MKNKKENTPAKEKILQVAQDLMLAKGFGATTIDQICQEAGLTKGGFFHYFKSKEELGKAVLDYYFVSRMMDLQTRPGVHDPDPIKRIDAFFQYIIDKSKEPGKKYGCLIGNFAQTVLETNPELGALCGEYFKTWVDFIKSEIDKVKQEYVPDAPIDSQLLAEGLFATYEGVLVLAKSSGDWGVVERNMLAYKQYMFSTIMQHAPVLK